MEEKNKEEIAKKTTKSSISKKTTKNKKTNNIKKEEKKDKFFTKDIKRALVISLILAIVLIIMLIIRNPEVGEADIQNAISNVMSEYNIVQEDELNTIYEQYTSNQTGKNENADINEVTDVDDPAFVEEVN